MQYIIYCDESISKGRYYSNFYGGALIEASRREGLEAVLNAARAGVQGEAKWTKISEYNEKGYIAFVDAIFDLISSGFLKMRIMFTQNINVIPKGIYEANDAYFKLYYQFVKHAFGLRHCNPGRLQNVDIAVYLDDAPDTVKKVDRFRDFLSSLSDYPVFKTERVRIQKQDITEVKSHDHVILQAVDVILGSMQFRLNEGHKEIPQGANRRGKRTRAKERVYRHINARLQEIYPRFNIGMTTGQSDGWQVRWRHPYRHWCFVPSQAVKDLTKGKRPKIAAPQTPT